MSVKSTCTEELESDLHAWLYDINAGLRTGDTQEIDDAMTIIEEQLPPFVLGWTVEELISAIRRR